MSYTQVLTTVLHSPVKKRAVVSPVIYVLLGGLVLYFMWRDVDLLVTLRKCDNRNLTQDLTVTSVKSLLQPPTIHYIELPLSEIMELELGLSSLVSPNTVSYSGVLIGLTAALLICHNRRLLTLAGVTLYKLRDLADSLDGVLARGAGVAMLPTPGTSGYYIDGWCDIISETALIYSVGVVILRDREKSWQGVRTSSKSIWSPSGLRAQLVTLCAPLTMNIWGLGLQSILAAVGWNWTTSQLHLLLEAGVSPSSHVQGPQGLTSPLAGLVVFLWRLLNPHMLTQALLVSLTLDRPGQWVELTRLVVTLPLLVTCVASYILVYSLRQQQNNL